jgi:capsular exopolysaccharide synthesis family protein
MNTDATPTLSLYLRVLWRRKWALLVPVLLATAAAYGLARSERPAFEAHTDLLFRALENSGGVPSQPADIPTEQRIATSPAVAEGAAKNLGDGTPAEAILGQVGALQVDQLAILRITARGPSADTARQVVSAVSAAYLTFRRERDAQNSGAITAAVERQTRALSDELEQLDQQITQRQLSSGGGTAGTTGASTRGALTDAAETDDSQLQAMRARRDTLLGQLAVNQGRLDQLKLQEVTRGAEVTVIVPTTSSEVPVEPRPKRSAAIGGLLGLLIGFGLVLVREQLNRGVRNVDELEQAVGASVRSTIPRVPSWRRRKEARLIMMEDAFSPTAEAYRILQSSLAFLEVGTSAKVLLLTSATPGEGKSTTAANLAIAFAEAGSRTVLVDADLRHPRLHKFFKVDNRSGLSDILTGRATFDQIVKAGGWHQSESGLALLTAGRPLGHTTKALNSPALTALLGRLRQADVVILDAPPTLPVADTALLATHADAVLVVANPSVSSRPALEQFGRRLPSLGAKVLGIVLNAPEPNRMPAEAYTYHYAYSAADPDRVQPSRAQRSRRRRTAQSSGGWR